jgi:hypothetical protein
MVMKWLGLTMTRNWLLKNKRKKEMKKKKEMGKLLDCSNLAKGGDWQSVSFDKQLNLGMENKRKKQEDLLRYLKREASSLLFVDGKVTNDETVMVAKLKLARVMVLGFRMEWGNDGFPERKRQRTHCSFISRFK